MQQTRNGFAVAAAACELKLKRLTPAQGRGAARHERRERRAAALLLMELARDRNDTEDQQRIVAQMERGFRRVQWLAEALFSSGNMYMLRRDYPHGGGVLQLPGRAFSDKARMPPPRTGGRAG